MGIAGMMAVLVNRGWHPGAMLFGVLIPLTIVGLVAYGIWELVHTRDTAAVPAFGASNQVLTVLDERFARGEIDAEEYLQRRSLLTSPLAPQGTPSDQVDPSTRPPGPTDAAEQPTGPTGTTEQPTQ